MVKAVGFAQPEDDSPHPRPDKAALVARIGTSQHRLVPILDEAEIRTTLVPVHYPQPSQQLGLGEAKHPRGRVADPFTHLRQRAHKHRAPEYLRLPYGGDAAPFDPDDAEPTAADLRRLTAETFDVQIARHGTLLLTPYHVAGRPGTRGRDLELLLAGGGVRLFRDQGLGEVFEDGGVPREVYVAIAVRAGDLLDPTIRRALADLYLALDNRPDGFWVKILNFDERASAQVIAACGAFLQLLREGGLPVVACGPGQLALGLWANDFAVCIGIGESERFVWPSNWRRMKKTEDGKPPGRVRYAYNKAFGRSFKLKSDDARRAFEAGACDCPHHDAPGAPPAASKLDFHATDARLEEFNALRMGDVATRRVEVLDRARTSERLGRAAELKYTSPAQFEALFSGIDNPDIKPARATGS